MRVGQGGLVAANPVAAATCICPNAGWVVEFSIGKINLAGGNLPKRALALVKRTARRVGLRDGGPRIEKSVLRDDRTPDCKTDMNDPAAAVFDITAGTTPELAHLEPPVGSRYKSPGTGFEVTQNCSDPLSLKR